MRYKCNYKCSKKRGMKILNELFERDVYLREAMDAESLHG